MDQIGYNMDKAKLASAIMMTLPGISWIYYGEELGMTGVGDHENIRQPFIWSHPGDYNATGKYNGISDWDERNSVLNGVSEQLLDNDSLLNTYIEMINLKQTNDVLKYGDLGQIDNTELKLMTYTRTYNGETYLVIHNMSQIDVTAETNLEAYEVIYQNEDFVYDNTSFTFIPYSTTILKISTDEITFE